METSPPCSDAETNSHSQSFLRSHVGLQQKRLETVVGWVQVDRMRSLPVKVMVIKSLSQLIPIRVELGCFFWIVRSHIPAWSAQSIDRKK